MVEIPFRHKKACIVVPFLQVDQIMTLPGCIALISEQQISRRGSSGWTQKEPLVFLFHVPAKAPTMTKSTPANLEFMVCNKPSELPPVAWTELHRHEVDANVVLPILSKCWRQEQKGIIAQDHLWIVSFVRSPVYAVKLILACTDSLTGKYPLFLFTPLPYEAMKDDAYIYPSLISAARQLQRHLPTPRIYSVFGRDILSRTFATIWAQVAKIPLVSEPYYDCKITYLTRATLELNRRELPPVPMAQIRPAERGDLDDVAQICHGFAALSPPFTLTEEGALAEARELIDNKIVWVLTLGAHRVVSLVAFTRNSENVATITKVFTDPTQRGGRYAERLVRAVCDYLLYDCSKEKVALFVGTDNPAAVVYQRVGFVGVGEGAAPADGVDTWCEIGFDPSLVDLGHW